MTQIFQNLNTNQRSTEEVDKIKKQAKAYEKVRTGTEPSKWLVGRFV